MEGEEGHREEWGAWRFLTLVLLSFAVSLQLRLCQSPWLAPFLEAVTSAFGNKV